MLFSEVDSLIDSLRRVWSIRDYTYMTLSVGLAALALLSDTRGLE